MRTAAAVRGPGIFRIAVVSDEEAVLPEAENFLAPHFHTTFIQSGDELMETVGETDFDAIILDVDNIQTSDGDGVHLLGTIRKMDPDMVLVACTRSSERSVKLRSARAGATEFFHAPVDFDELRIVLQRALEKRAIEIENRLLREQLAEKYQFCDLIGGSDPMHRVYDAIRRVAPSSNTTVLIRGESGTGKELVARAIVQLSPRRDKPFVSVNCAALPENLIEAELFGYEKGSFTGATAAHAGHIEMADTGTLFLDEIATLGLGLQTKLLRVLEDRAVQRIGSKSSRKIDFRLLTATNEDLEGMVNSGRFREDLYYRIHVIPISLPPLREREEDIALLVDHFLKIYCTANGVPAKRVEPDAMEVLEAHPWPGNVRELENTMQRLVLMVEGTNIRLRDLPEKLLVHSATSHEALLIPEEGIEFDEEMRRIEIAYLQAAISRAGRKSAAAALLHIPPQKMKYLCRKYGL
jgi:DNA-binding NtrC family response regulator